MNLITRKTHLAPFLVGLALALPVVGVLQADPPDHNWNSPQRLRESVEARFADLQTFTADFRITTVEGNRSSSMSGTLYYQKPGRLRYEFSQPAGNLIVSDGEIMWYYIRRANIVGQQSLTLNTENESQRPIFSEDPGPGVSRLFDKYHYRFLGTAQPRAEFGGRYFVLDLDQRERTGGYQKIVLYVDAETYMIHRAEADDGYGKKTSVVFSNIRVNPQLEGRLFQYSPPDNVRVVPNPFVREDAE